VVNVTPRLLLPPCKEPW